jgi:lysophospholipase L1-like esterase
MAGRERQNWWTTSHSGAPGWLIAATVLVLAVVGVLWGVRSTHEPRPAAADARTSSPSATPTPAPEPTTDVVKSVAFVGDSYTSGAGASAPSLRWTDIVAARFGWEQFNLGVGGTGYVTVGSLEGGNVYPDRIPQIIESAPDLVILSGGRNDIDAHPEAIATSALTVIDSVRAQLPGAEFAVLSPVWDDDEAPAELAAVASALRGAAETAGAAYIDTGQPLAGHPEMLTEDGVHPNDGGYVALAQSIGDALAAAGFSRSS